MKANKLKAILTEHGKTQKWLSEQLNISEQTLSRKLSGISPFLLHEVHLIKSCLSLTNEEVVDIFLD